VKVSGAQTWRGEGGGDESVIPRPIPGADLAPGAGAGGGLRVTPEIASDLLCIGRAKLSRHCRIYACQSFPQAITRWDQPRAQTLANVTSLTVVVGALSVVSDLDELERLCGRHRVRKESTPVGVAPGHSTATRTWEVGALPEGRALVLWGSLGPIISRLDDPFPDRLAAMLTVPSSSGGAGWRPAPEPQWPVADEWEAGAWGAGRKRPWDWFAVRDEADSAEVHGEGLALLACFNSRYAWIPTQAIPACWAGHGGLVDELTTLMWSRWAAFSSGSASAEAAKSWHRQSLPSFMGRLDTRIGGVAATGECRPGSHQGLSFREAVEDVGQLAERLGCPETGPA